MEKKTKKPKSYDFFKGKENPNEQKGVFAKIWKWFKIFIYAFIFGTSLTGCIQSFVIKSSVHTGAGIEFYNSSDAISPNAVVFRKETNSEGKEVIVKKKTNDNFYVSNQDEVGKNVISELKKQANGKYGDWANYNALILFQNEKGEYEYAKGDETMAKEYLFINSSMNEYNQKYNWTDIKFLSALGETIKHEEEYVNKADPNVNSYIWKVNNQIAPNETKLENNNKFSRDFIHYLNSKILTFDEFKDGKLDRAISEIELKGRGASQENIDIVKNYTKTLKPILTDARYTKIYNNELHLETSNLKDRVTFYEAIPYSLGEPQKPVVTWGDSWGLGPFYGLFIWPMSKIMIALADSMSLMSTFGWSSIITILIGVLITKIISFSFRFKSLFSQNKQQELQVKKAKIDAKYLPHKGNKQMEARQKQEIADLYKKNNVSPVEPFKQLLITMPIFIAMWRILQGIPSIKATTWLAMNLSSTSWQELFGGNWIYLPILLITAIIQIVQQILPRILAKKNKTYLMNAAETAAMKKQRKTQLYTGAIFLFMGLMFQASIQIYWIFGGLWEIGQILFVHYFQRTKLFKEKVRPWINKKKPA
ncbi:membrane protein insertase YidC [Mesomycoplasma lagogenitalium]|uniref:Membrane protein insertase YidC n=1 Tax=Mesomycoplasma lagogenitalium TaxID=171286 RepID=A0ABY8LWM8_9BACT|nr:membrane protein insertase YidC [Mesomycoplasma lagogenitalium]WGI36656.1 membrane protein insertase YidC [Mesomycoplasma lagogenitalium]